MFLTTICLTCSSWGYPSSFCRTIGVGKAIFSCPEDMHVDNWNMCVHDFRFCGYWWLPCQGSEHSPLDVAGVILQSPLESANRGPKTVLVRDRLETVINKA